MNLMIPPQRWRHAEWLFLLLFALSPSPAVAQEKKASAADERISFQLSVGPEDPFAPHYKVNAPNGNDAPFKVRRGEAFRITIVGTPKEGYHTYPISRRTALQPPSQVSHLEVGTVKGLTSLWPIYETEPSAKQEGKITYLEHEKPFTWSQDVLVGADAPTGMVQLPIKLEVYVCDDHGCVPVKATLETKVEITSEEPAKTSEGLLQRLGLKKPEVQITDIPGEKDVAEIKAVIAESLIKSTPVAYKAKLDELAKHIVVKPGIIAGQDDTDLLAFVLAGIFWGAISLITPCVFPMIPITVSYFLKQSEKEHHRPVVMASIYSATIVVVLTLAAAFLLSIFRWLSVLPLTNYFLGGLFIFFALSLFGMYEIELPTSLAQFTSSREGKGGVVGTVFMALTFTIISFACVAPFLGGFSGTAAKDRPLWHNLLGGLAFSVTFASPFFFLALFPALLRKLPKSGSWLNSVKVVMGFLELAAAFKFFRSAELVQTAGAPSFFTFDLVLGLWIALCVLCGLYLIGVFRLPHDTPEEHVSVPRMLFSGAFFCLALYLAPALFKNAAGQPQRPTGTIYAWIDSFLLPESKGAGDIPVTGNLDYAVTAAREHRKKTGQPKRIFIDFTGVSCTNCKINESNVFAKPNVAKLFEPYIVVQLYTDIVPKEFYAAEALATNDGRQTSDAKQVNLPFQVKVFGTEVLPLYVVIEPELDGTIRTLGAVQGRIFEEQKFMEFLRNPEGK
jgi:thiol:disulfide interchange protein